MKKKEKMREGGYTHTLHPLILSFSCNTFLPSQGNFLIQSLTQGLMKGSLGCTSTGEHRARFPCTLNIRTGFHPSLIPLPLKSCISLCCQAIVYLWPMRKWNLLARAHIYSVVHFPLFSSLIEIEPVKFARQIIRMKYHTRDYCKMFFPWFPFLPTAVFIMTLPFWMMADVWDHAGQFPKGRATSDVKSRYNFSVTCSIYAGSQFWILQRNYQIASGWSPPPITRPTAVGSAQRAALPQELNLIRTLGREWTLLLLSQSLSKSLVTPVSLA